jgi:hypothetical protein
MKLPQTQDSASGCRAQVSFEGVQIVTPAAVTLVEDLSFRLEAGGQSLLLVVRAHARSYFLHLSSFPFLSSFHTVWGSVCA